MDYLMLGPDITELQKYSEAEVDMNEKKHILCQWKKSILYSACVSLPIMAICIMFFAYIEIVQEEWITRFIVFAVLSTFFVGFIRIARNVQHQILWYKNAKNTEWVKWLIYIENVKHGKLYGTYIKEGELYRTAIAFQYSDFSPGAYKALIHMKRGEAPILLVKWLKT